VFAFVPLNKKALTGRRISGKIWPHPEALRSGRFYLPVDKGVARKFQVPLPPQF
jgi:hypothetical protein